MIKKSNKLMGKIIRMGDGKNQITVMLGTRESGMAMLAWEMHCQFVRYYSRKNRFKRWLRSLLPKLSR